MGNFGGLGFHFEALNPLEPILYGSLKGTLMVPLKGPYLGTWTLKIDDLGSDFGALGL